MPPASHPSRPVPAVPLPSPAPAVMPRLERSKTAGPSIFDDARASMSAAAPPNQSSPSLDPSVLSRSRLASPRRGRWRRFLLQRSEKRDAAKAVTVPRGDRDDSTNRVDVVDRGDRRRKAEKGGSGVDVLLRAMRGGGSGMVGLHGRWEYRIYQGAEVRGVREVRSALEGRCWRKGGMFEGPDWGRLIVGPAFHEPGEGVQKRQVHCLEYVASVCGCLKCLVKEAETEMDVPSDGDDLFVEDCQEVKKGGEVSEEQVVRADSVVATFADGVNAIAAARGGSKVEGTILGNGRGWRASGGEDETPDSVPAEARNPAASSVVDVELPSLSGMSLLEGVRAGTTQFLLGTLSRLHSRGSARLTLSSIMREFVGHAAHCGPVPLSEMLTTVLEFGKAHYRKHKGKRDRQVFIRGEMLKMPLPFCVVDVGATPLNTAEPGSVAVLAPAQEMNLVSGEIVLEGSFGSTIDTKISWYVGFGADRGSQAIYADGSLGPRRTFGINELCVHSEGFGSGPKTYKMY